MDDLKTKLARCLEEYFDQNGFSGPSVPQLRDACGVSLRTLYRYFPSREDMVVGALEHRNAKYLNWLAQGAEQTQGAEHILAIYRRLGEWLENGATHGCFFLRAIAAYPNDPAVRRISQHHKDCVRQEFHRRVTRLDPDCDHDELVETLCAIHEGQTDTAVTRDAQTATRAALRLGRVLLKSEGILQ
jgi:AcrR family transcriptional regulator